MLEHAEIPMIDIHTGVPFAIRMETTENEEIECRLEEMIRSPANTPNNANTSLSPVPWPTVGERPVNEFTTEGYIAMAFPTLFPTGAADLRDCHQPKGGGENSRIFQESVDLQGWTIWESSSVCLPQVEIDIKIRFLRFEHKATRRGPARSTIIY